MRAGWAVLLAVLVGCGGSDGADGGTAGGSGGAAGSAGGGVSGAGGGESGAGGGTVTGAGGGDSGTGGGITGTGGGDSGTGGGTMTGTGGGMMTGTGGGMTGGTGGGMMGGAVDSIAITAPTGTVTTNGTVMLTLAIVGTPDTVSILADGSPVASVPAPFTNVAVDTTLIAEGTRQLVARATKGSAYDDSAPLMVVVDRTPPMMTRGWPIADGWVGEGIGVEFSEPVVPASVTANALTASLPTAAAQLSADQRTITAQLTGSPSSFPHQLTITVGAGLKDAAGNAFAGTSWMSTFSRWSASAVPVAALNPRVAVDANGVSYVVSSENGSVQVRVLAPGKFELLGMPWGGGAGDIAIDNAGRPVVAHIGSGNIHVKRYENGSWQPLGGALGAGTTPDLAVDGAGNPVVAWVEAGVVRVSQWTGSSWSQLAPLATTAALTPSVQVGGGGVFVAYSENGQVRVEQHSGGAWTPVGGALNVSFKDSATFPSLVRTTSQELFVAWEEASNVFAARWDGTGGFWSRSPRALDIDLPSRARWPAMASGLSGNPVVVWTEQTHWGQWMVQCSRFDGSWKLCGGDAAALQPRLNAPSVAMAGEMPVVTVSGAQLHVHRYNGVGVAPTWGIAQRPAASACNITAEPQMQLSQTQCFDVSTNPPTPAADLIPFDLNAPLWSDGALKRRWIRLPPGKNVTYSGAGPMSFPTGTLMVKEFSYTPDLQDATSRRAIETRFFVKREDAGWEGYSYQWNDAFTDATLLFNDSQERKRWPYTGLDAGFSHVYPGRSECFQCHRTNVPVLGMHAGQLNRNFDYGGGKVDNQLRVMERIGVFGPNGDTSDAGRVVNLLDTTEPLELRMRGYLAGNCGHCHRPGGLRQTVFHNSRDFRWEPTFEETRLCDPTATGGVEFVPGDAGASLIIQRMSVRGVHGPPLGQMPPIATDNIDAKALEVISDFINTTTRTCP